MASAAIHGRYGTIRLSTSSSATTAQTKIAELNTYTITNEADTIDVTNHDSTGHMETLLGTRRWSAECDVMYLSTGAGQALARIEFSTASPQRVYITLTQTTSLTAKLWKGRAWITGWTASHDQNDAVKGTLRFVGSGALARTA